MEHFMRRAIELARKAASLGDAPVGCVIVCGEKVVGEGYNRKEYEQNPLLHAEIIAINAVARALGSWRLTECTLYVTLEPCPMCAGAILGARVGTVVYGAPDTSMGACGGVMNIFEEAFGYRPNLYGGVLAEECGALMSDFFRTLRQTDA